MQYTIKKHCGLRVDMKHIYNGSYGSFNDVADAIAWAHFKHDNLNNTYICLDDDTIIYGIVPTSNVGYYTDRYKEHMYDFHPLEFPIKLYKIAKVK